MARFRLIIDFDDGDNFDVLETQLVASMAVAEMRRASHITIESAELIDAYASDIDNDTSLLPCEVDA